MDKSSTILNDSLDPPAIEDTLNIATKDWNRVINAASKTGYREGIDAGSESVFQEGFDQGYDEAFKTAFLLGKFKSLLNAMPKDTKHPPDIIEILDKTRRGACYICKLESGMKDDIEKQPFSDSLNKQREHTKELIQRLTEYFEPITEQLNMNMSAVSHCQPTVNQLEST